MGQESTKRNEVKGSDSMHVQGVQIPSRAQKPGKRSWEDKEGRVRRWKGKGEAVSQASAGGSRSRRRRPRCARDHPFLFLTMWCRNTWLSASQGAGGEGSWVKGAPAPHPHPTQPVGSPPLTVHIRMANPNHEMPHV